MSKSIFDTRFTSKKMALDSAVADAFVALDEWRTIHGAHVEIDENGTIIRGAGGKFDGSNINSPRKTSEQSTKTDRQNNAQEKEKTQKIIKNRMDELQTQKDKAWEKYKALRAEGMASNDPDAWEKEHQDEIDALSKQYNDADTRLSEYTNYRALQGGDKDEIRKHFALRLGPSHGQLKGGLLTNPDKFATNIDEINRIKKALDIKT